MVFKWVLLTLVVIAAIAGMVRLGIWQLDRLAQRRSFNAGVLANEAMPALDLNAYEGDEGLTGMAYRSVTVRGEYLFDQQVMLRNQVDAGRTGVHLLTPLKIGGRAQAILVDRGWIPLEDANPDKVNKYNLPGEVQVTGVLRTGRAGLRTGTQDTANGRLVAVNVVDIQALAAQSDPALLPVFIQETPGNQPAGLPIPSALELDLTEGPHGGYALQWFTFAALLAGGYPYFVYTRFWKPATRKG